MPLAVLRKSFVAGKSPATHVAVRQCFKMTTVNFTVGLPNCRTPSGADKVQNVSKMCAAHTAVDKHVKNGMKLGIGSGSTIVYSIQRLAQRVKDESLAVVCVPTSYQARQLIIDHNLPLGNLDTHPILDCTIDGADEIETGTLTCIKGGGGCLTQEKIVASCSKQLIIVADGEKEVSNLGEKWKKGVPIEVIPMAYKPIQQKIETKYGGEAILRMSADKAGPLVTDNGNFLLDWVFPNVKYCWSSVHNYLKLIPGMLCEFDFLVFFY
ncbi:Hypothetical protein CINCED_3A013985 [Cinara cedri]|uniref:ribose-5-phosphate isomerase n=1 Tax=Cinara cedri TaxID=506608 RepID=A0A5E4N1B1_9HEMI|nr:Hypothetical protein CINCED_3A013985 [Cinara cedri]